MNLNPFQWTPYQKGVAALVLGWAVLVLYWPVLISMPIVYFVTAFIRSSAGFSLCPLCASFYITWGFQLLMYALGTPVAPLWLTMTLMGVSGGNVARKVGYGRTERGEGTGMDWAILNYWFLIGIIVVSTVLVLLPEGGVV